MHLYIIFLTLLCTACTTTAPPQPNQTLERRQKRQELYRIHTPQLTTWSVFKGTPSIVMLPYRHDSQDYQQAETLTSMQQTTLVNQRIARVYNIRLNTHGKHTAFNHARHVTKPYSEEELLKLAKLYQPHKSVQYLLTAQIHANKSITYWLIDIQNERTQILQSR